MNIPYIGITFSHTHLQYLGIQTTNALSYALSMGFSHIRLGCYWNRIEKSKNTYDFGELERMLEKCEAAAQPIIMNVGMKSPRWPEFYLPSYLDNTDIESYETKERTLLFIEAIITKLKSYTCITHWQVENEPLDPSGPFNLTIHPSLLQQEVDVVRSLDKRPIIITLWGNELEKRNFLPMVLPFSDVIGLDIYYKQYMRELFGKSLYSGPQTNDVFLSKLIKDCAKPIIITELQGEPWEKDEQACLSEKQRSITPELLSKNIERASRLGAKEILLWGFEYWYYQMKQGNSEYIEIVKELLQ